MPRRVRDDALFALPAGRRGRVESALNKAVRIAQMSGDLEGIDVALVTLARALARAIDTAEAARDVWATARVAGELRETLIRLRLDRASRGVDRDAVAEFFASLAEPAAAGAPSPAPVGDPAQS